ncbi:MAG: hypothetical protein U0929_13780 [Planctomycetaceae bacterium]
MFRLLVAVASLLLMVHPLPADEATSTPPTVIRYSAGLSETTSNGNSRLVREFEIRSLVLPQNGGYPSVLYLIEDAGEDQPWFERFGQVKFDPQGQPSPRLAMHRHIHGGHSSWIGLRFGHFPGFDKLQPGAEWTEGQQTYRLQPDKVINAEPCWQLEINAPQSRRTLLSIRKTDGAILAAQQRYFVGMGERFDLKLQLEEIATASPETITAWTTAAVPLLKLKQDIKFDLGEEESLSKEQLQQSEAALNDIDKATDGTPFDSLAGVIRREVTASQQRETAVADLATRFVGRPAPPITVTPLNGGPAVTLSKPGRVTILHFWEYQEKPLTEPYGQVGYLDFLSQKRKDQIQVIGIIADKQLQEPGAALAALRSARKLQEFMNIGYLLGHETEGALAALGDPRKFGVALPLWVVIGADGTILHYRVGYYEVDANRGLEELDAVVEKALKAK